MKDFLIFPRESMSISFGYLHSMLLIPEKEEKCLTLENDSSKEESVFDIMQNDKDDDLLDDSEDVVDSNADSNNVSETLIFAVDRSVTWAFYPHYRKRIEPKSPCSWKWRKALDQLDHPSHKDQLNFLRGYCYDSHVPEDLLLELFEDEKSSKFNDPTVHLFGSSMIRIFDEFFVFTCGPNQNELYYFGTDDGIQRKFYNSLESIDNVKGAGNFIVIATISNFIVLQCAKSSKDGLLSIVESKKIPLEGKIPVTDLSCKMIDGKLRVCSLFDNGEIGFVRNFEMKFRKIAKMDVSNHFNCILQGMYLGDVLVSTSREIYLMDNRFDDLVRVKRLLYQRTDDDSVIKCLGWVPGIPQFFLLVTGKYLKILSQIDGSEVSSWSHGIKDPTNIESFSCTTTFSFDSNFLVFCIYSTRGRQVCLITVRKARSCGPFISIGSPLHLPLYPAFQDVHFKEHLLRGVHISFGHKENGSRLEMNVHSALYHGQITKWTRIVTSPVSEFQLTSKQIKELEQITSHQENENVENVAHAEVVEMEEPMSTEHIQSMDYKLHSIIDVTKNLAPIFSDAKAREKPVLESQVRKRSLYPHLNSRLITLTELSPASLSSSSLKSIINDFFKGSIPAHFIPDPLENIQDPISLDLETELVRDFPDLKQTDEITRSSPLLTFMNDHWDRGEAFLPFFEPSVALQRMKELETQKNRLRQRQFHRATNHDKRHRNIPTLMKSSFPISDSQPLAFPASEVSPSSSSSFLAPSLPFSQSMPFPMTQPVTRQEIRQAIKGKKKKRRTGF